MKIQVNYHRDVRYSKLIEVPDSASQAEIQAAVDAADLPHIDRLEVGRTEETTSWRGWAIR